MHFCRFGLARTPTCRVVLGFGQGGSNKVVSGPLSVVRGPLSVVSGPLSVVRCPWSVVRLPWSGVRGPWSVVLCRQGNREDPFLQLATGRVERMRDEG